MLTFYSRLIKTVRHIIDGFCVSAIALDRLRLLDPSELDAAVDIELHRLQHTAAWRGCSGELPTDDPVEHDEVLGEELGEQILPVVGSATELLREVGADHANEEPGA